MSDNDSKTRMRQNIKQHRLKLLQILERTDETNLKPKIEMVSKYVENLHLKSKMKIIDPEPSPMIKRKLSDQLLEEAQYYDSSDDSNEASFDDSGDGNISVGNEDCNEAFTIHNYSYVDKDNKRNATYLDNDYSSDIPTLDFNGSTTKRRRWTGKNIKYQEELLEKSQTLIDKLSMKRKKSNKKEKKNRYCEAKLFEILKNSCSNFTTRRIVASKASILDCAKEECVKLKCIQDHLCRKKKRYQLLRAELKNRLAEMNHESKL